MDRKNGEKIYQGNMVEIFRAAPGIYHRKGNLKERRQCDGAFILGGAGVIALDAPPGGIEMADEAEKLFGRPLDTLILTHGHGDHVEGLGDFLDRDDAGGFPLGLKVYCHRRLLETFRSGGTIDLVKNRRTCFVGVEGGARLCFSGGMELELLTLPDTAHSKWDLFVFIPGEGILCTGDAVVEYQTAYFHGADIQSWISSLRHLAGLKGRAVLSGHGPSLFPWNYIGEFADFLETLERAARTCLARYGDSWKTDKERFALVDTASVRTLVDQYFAEGEEDARFIAAKAGDDDGRREVRMVLWSFIREYIR